MTKHLLNLDATIAVTATPRPPWFHSPSQERVRGRGRAPHPRWVMSQYLTPVDEETNFLRVTLLLLTLEAVSFRF